MKYRPSTIAWIVCLVAGLLVFGLYSVQNSVPKDDNEASAFNGAVGGPFSLIDQDGHKVTEKSWPGNYLLVYFGFTHCPDVCPTGLNRIAEALNALPAEQLAKIQPVFITVDPDRDKPADLKNYVGLFHPKLVGLTGTTEQVEKAEAAYKVYAQKQGDGDDYMVNHSAFTYLMTPDGGVADLFSHDISSQDMAKQISQALNKK
jgi:cytochrome oxidase Cu insertion factor (SCO1/SenC/PrrC family)